MVQKANSFLHPTFSIDSSSSAPFPQTASESPLSMKHWDDTRPSEETHTRTSLLDSSPGLRRLWEKASMHSHVFLSSTRRVASTSLPSPPPSPLALRVCLLLRTCLRLFNLQPCPALTLPYPALPSPCFRRLAPPLLSHPPAFWLLHNVGHSSRAITGQWFDFWITGQYRAVCFR